MLPSTRRPTALLTSPPAPTLNQFIHLVCQLVGCHQFRVLQPFPRGSLHQPKSCTALRWHIIARTCVMSALKMLLNLVVSTVGTIISK